MEPALVIAPPSAGDALNALRVLWDSPGVDIDQLRASYGQPLDTRITVEDVAKDVFNRFILSREG